MHKHEKCPVCTVHRFIASMRNRPATTQWNKMLVVHTKCICIKTWTPNLVDGQSIRLSLNCFAFLFCWATYCWAAPAIRAIRYNVICHAESRPEQNEKSQVAVNRVDVVQFSRCFSLFFIVASCVCVSFLNSKWRAHCNHSRRRTHIHSPFVLMQHHISVRTQRIYVYTVAGAKCNTRTQYRCDEIDEKDFVYVVHTVYEHSGRDGTTTWIQFQCRCRVAAAILHNYYYVYFSLLMFYSVWAMSGGLGFLWLYACDGERCVLAICVSAINTNQKTATTTDFNKLAYIPFRTQTPNKCSFTIYYIHTIFIDREMTFAHTRER